MNAKNIRQSDLLPDNLIIFPNFTGFAGRPVVLSPSNARVSKVSLKNTSKTRSRGMTEDPVAQSRLAELFALKREEKAPENYVRDALEVFHRRNGISGVRFCR